jgi:hypothetical protein
MRGVVGVVQEGRVEAVRLQVCLVDDVQPIPAAQLVPAQARCARGVWCVNSSISTAVVKVADPDTAVRCTGAGGSCRSGRSKAKNHSHHSPGVDVGVVAGPDCIEVALLHQQDVSHHVALINNLACSQGQGISRVGGRGLDAAITCSVHACNCHGSPPTFLKAFLSEGQTMTCMCTATHQCNRACMVLPYQVHTTT